MIKISVNGTELWCVDRGAGLPLLLVHGFPLDHTMWTAQIDELSSKYRVIAPDLRGLGRSRGNQMPKVTMAQFADDLAALLDSLGIAEPVVFCGLSMGGYIAFQFWRKYASRLRGLILCDTRATADSPEIAAGRHIVAKRVLSEGPTPLVESMMPRLFAEMTRLQDPQIIESLRNVMMSNDPRGIAAAALGMAERPDMTAELKQVCCPTLVIVGENDVISPPSAMRAIADAIPGSKFVQIPEVGHMAPMEAPAEVNAAISEFLAGL
jgi:3-oxoadipate enol-lactonase